MSGGISGGRCTAGVLLFILMDQSMSDTEVDVNEVVLMLLRCNTPFSVLTVDSTAAAVRWVRARCSMNAIISS